MSVGKNWTRDLLVIRVKLDPRDHPFGLVLFHVNIEMCAFARIFFCTKSHLNIGNSFWAEFKVQI